MARKSRTQLSAAPVAEGVRFTIGTATAFAVRRESKDIALRIRRERRPLQQAMSRTPFVRGMQRLIRATFGLIDGISESAELYPQRVSRGNRLERGALKDVCLATFGVGLSWGFALLDLSQASFGGVGLYKAPSDRPTRAETVKKWIDYYRGGNA